MKQVRFAVIGTNFISDLFCDAVRKTDGCSVTAVYSRKNETGAAFAEKNGLGARVFDDLDRMLAQADLFDAVYIASPHFCHMEQSIKAMNAGRHVLVEKAAGLNLRQFDTMRRAAEENGVVLCEAMRPWFDPALRVIRENVARCGTVRHARFEFCQYSSRYDKFLAGEVLNAFDPSLSNAAILDIGIYCAANAVYLFGAPQRVQGASVFLSNGMEAGGTVTLFYDGFVVELCYSKVFQSNCRCRIDGEKGSLAYTLPSVPHDAVFLRREGREFREEPIALPTAENNMIYEVAAFRDFVRTGRMPTEEQNGTAAVLSVLDAARRDAGVRFVQDEAD